VQRSENARGCPPGGVDTPKIAHDDGDSTSIAALLRGTGRATLDEIAASTGQPRLEVVKAIAGCSGDGIIRLTLGTRPRIRGFRASGWLEIADGDDRCTALFARPPWKPLDTDRRLYLDTFLESLDGSLSLGSVAFVCAGLWVGSARDPGGALSFNSDELEDYLGVPRGSMR
jgi:hypothetical protein